MKTLLQTYKFEREPEPEPAPESPVRVSNDRERVVKTITHAELPEHQAKGWSIVPPGAVPQALGIPYEEAAATPSAPRGLHLTKAPDAGSYDGTISWWKKESRDALHAAATALAPRVGGEPLKRDSFRGEPKSTIADIFNTAIIGQVVVQLAKRVDALEAALAAKESNGHG